MKIEANDHNFLSILSYILAVVTLITSLIYFGFNNIEYSTWFLIYTVLLIVNGNSQYNDYLRAKDRK